MSDILVSDAERERAVVALRDATVEGRLTLDEFSERIGSAELARTSAELEQALAGLPAIRAFAADAPERHSAVFSRLQRSGRWELAADSVVRCVGGTIDLELGRATLAARETTLHVRNWFGTVQGGDGGGPFGTRDIQLADAGPVPDAPRLRIHTAGVGGTVRVLSEPSA